VLCPVDGVRKAVNDLLVVESERLDWADWRVRRLNAFHAFKGAETWPG